MFARWLLMRKPLRLAQDSKAKKGSHESLACGANVPASMLVTVLAISAIEIGRGAQI